MKKLIVLLAALMLLTMIALPAFAAGTEIAVTASGDVIYAGEEVTFTIKVSGDAPYTSLGFVLSFDTEVFDFVGYEEADTGALIHDFDRDTNMYGIAFAEPKAYAGTILTVTLKVKADAPFVTSTVGGQVSAKNGVDPIAVTLKAAQVTIGCRHSYTWVKTDDAKHTGTCSSCGDVKAEEHTWSDEGTNVKPATCEEAGSETFECLICDAAKTVELKAKGHAWDNECDTDCNNDCGTTREITHKYGSEWYNDENNHWHTCDICGDEKGVAAHVPGPEATETDPQVCTECGYVIKKALGHIHDFDTNWQQDAENHWHICKKQGCYSWGSTAPHDYDDACDVTCNTCGHVRVAPHEYSMEWKGNAQGHWHDCSLCGAQSEILEHVPGDAATEEKPQVCTECQYWLQFPLNHEHTYTDEWESDDTNHWQICSECTELSEAAPHNWDDGTVEEEPTETKEGVIKYVCKDCKAERTAVLPVIETEPPTTRPAETQTPTTPSDDDGGFPWWILIALAGVLLVTGIVLFVIEFIRSRKNNMHGRFSS